MLSEYSSRDRELTQNFHEALLTYFCQAFDDSLQDLLYECSFGFAPSPTGEQTFFIIASSLDDTEELVNVAERLVGKIMDLMPGISKLALCCQPPQTSAREAIDRPNFLYGRIVAVPRFSLE
ncbi:hypothetical protein AY599_22165 [Leptolyngbya valderiana BDU 20041]|uniref:hypothetical protein n=1 Tax=Baaleninema simplex TaxID=2862350 RepID=UPI0003474469|nr:hypothetical protein [Baaleninema simplex]MDC0834092.1 hypothetical protein [Geitlerinema sp. CS-897]OAB62072.1 hypothetical protein AY599_22165 [Leptolyngbya valderiana BDU 20041]PPT09461.1 hypothetical protein CKA32_002380 [Geitlerinema sp. FC II]